MALMVLSWTHVWPLAVAILVLAVQYLWLPRQKPTTGSKDKQREIVPLPYFDLAAAEPHPYRPWKSGKFVMTMGIQKVEESDWLALDNRYLPEQAFRRELLATKRHNVLQVLPGSEAACAEVLEVVVNYVTQRYPTLFYSPAGKEDYVYNSLTGLTFKVTYPYELEPLEIAAQLVMEDLNVLLQGFGEDSEQHYL